MSLLLDALKKAADDKKKSVDEPAAKSPVQDNTQINDEDSLELELDEKQLTDNDTDGDNDFPRVDEQPIAPQKPQASSTETVTETTVEHLNDTASKSKLQNTDLHANTDTAHTEKPVELELAATENTHTEATDEPAQTPAKPQAETAEPSTTDSPDSVTDTVYQPQQQATAAETVDTVSSAVHQAGRNRHSADNEAALSALINKSNQYQQRAQKKRMILLVVLILLLISGSAGFFYLKAEMASQELYIAQNTQSPLPVEPVAIDKSQQPAGNQSVVTASDNRQNLTAEPAQRNNTASQAPAEAAISKPPAPQKVRSAGDTVTRNASNKTAESRIHIQQSSREDPLESLIMNAYNAFQRGDYGRAETLYQQVLTDEPRNRDANLGLAAIALKQQRYEYAKQKYLALLQLNPKDSLAIAGLSSLSQVSAQNLADSGLSESQLKFMLKEQPDAAHLYFALGSLYAAKNQWPQAQSAYFSAWSGDSNQADYAFNLAVSLDHINQPQQALQYYQLSLKLMRSSAANFSATQVEQRINSLQEAMQ
ncbi:MAG TPA: tetratricopeptide repeat protein [Gammaproteobacteria bacterium]